MIIGVTGKFCAGKDSFAAYLEKKGFEHFSLSDIIREELEERGAEKSLQNVVDLGNELRRKQGNGVLAKRALSRMKEGNYVVSSIRNPDEIRELKKSGSFVLISVDAPLDIRFARMQSRGKKEREPETLEEFKAMEDKQINGKGSDQNLRGCIDLAKFTLLNDTNKEDFERKIEKMMPEIESAANFSRPSWDEYFMDLTRAASKRATCDRGRTASVIVKDKRVLTTGYVGSPSNLPHCDEVGHWFKKTIHEDGSVTQHCIRTVHSEANAIAQAAKHGIDINGATIYMKLEPCLDCTKLLISSGIKRIVCEKRYHGAEAGRKMLKDAGVEVEVLNEEMERYGEEAV